MKKKGLFLSLAVIAVALSLATGATFALFTGSVEKNINVNSGNIRVTADMTLTQVRSLNSAPVDATGATLPLTFGNGASASIDASTLTLNNVSPGDGVSVKLTIADASSIAVKYNVKAAFTGDAELIDAMSVTVGSKTAAASGSVVLLGWTDGARLAPENASKELVFDIDLSAAAGNEAMEKNVSIKVALEALQANAVTEVELPPAAGGDTPPAAVAQAIQEAVNTSSYVAIPADVNLTETVDEVTGTPSVVQPIQIDKDTTVDLNGNALNVSFLPVDQRSGAAVFAARAVQPAQAPALFNVTGGTLTLVNGNIAVTDGTVVSASGAGTKVVVESGSYSTAYRSARHLTLTDVVYATDGAAVEINGGSFTAEGIYRPAGGLLWVQSALVEVKNGSSVVVNGGNFVSDQYGIGVFADSKAVINGGSIRADWQCIGLNNGYAPVTLEVNGGTLVSRDGTAIYLSAFGSATINDGDISGLSAVDIRTGSLTVNGGALKGMGAKKTVAAAPGGGSSDEGSAIVAHGELYENNTADPNVLNVTIGAGAQLTAEDGAPVTVYDWNKVAQTVNLALGAYADTVDRYAFVNGAVVPVQKVATLAEAAGLLDTNSAVYADLGGKTLTCDAPITVPAGKTLVLDDATVGTSGRNALIAGGGALFLKNVTLNGSNDPGVAPLCVTGDSSVLDLENCAVNVSGNGTANSLEGSKYAIQVAETVGNSAAAPKGVKITLTGTTVQMLGTNNVSSAVRGIGFANESPGSVVTLDNSSLYGCVDYENAWAGNYSRGIDVNNGHDVTVNVVNNSRVLGWQYALNLACVKDDTGANTANLTVNAADSAFSGWAALNNWSSRTTVTFTNCDLTGFNPATNGDKTYKFATIVYNDDIYNKGTATARNNTLALDNCNVYAKTAFGQKEQSLIYIEDAEQQAFTIQGGTKFYSVGGSGKVPAIAFRDACYQGGAELNAFLAALTVADTVSIETPDTINGMTLNYNTYWSIQSINSAANYGSSIDAKITRINTAKANWAKLTDAEKPQVYNAYELFATDMNSLLLLLSSNMSAGAAYCGIVLDADIDLTGFDFTGITLYNVVIDGNGHKLIGVSESDLTAIMQGSQLVNVTFEPSAGA